MDTIWIWIFPIIVFSTLTKKTHLQPLPSPQEEDKELPLSRSLGYRVRRLFRETGDDRRISQEYLELYQEMMKASQETLEKFDEAEQDKLMTIVGREKLEIMKRGLKDRRRSVSRLQSPVGKRRVRSQATRREKLNGQSLRSHQQHIRQAGRGQRRGSGSLRSGYDDGRDYEEDGEALKFI